MSNSLTELNAFSSIPVLFQDDRDYIVEVTGTAVTQNVTVGEDQAHLLPKSWTFRLLQSVPGNITMWIDASANPSPVAGNLVTSWSTTTLPQGVTLANPAPGVFKLQGLNGKAVFDQLSSPRITAKDRSTNFSYTANVLYPTPGNPAVNQEIAWTVNATVANSHAELSAASNISWTEDTGSITVTGQPLITDAYSEPGNYTLTITPSDSGAIYQVQNLGTANSTFNGSTRVLSMTDSKANINNSLGNLRIIPTSDYGNNFNMLYSLTNPVSALITTQTQNFNVTGAQAEYSLAGFALYRDIENPLSVSITDTDPDLPEYTVIISQVDARATPVWGEFSTTASGPAQPGSVYTVQPSVISGTRNTLTLRGTAADLNALQVCFKTSEWFAGGATKCDFVYTQIKHDPVQGDIIQASEVAFAGTFTESFAFVTGTQNYTEDKAVVIRYVISDSSARFWDKEFALSITQTSPSANPGTFVYRVGNPTVGFQSYTTENALNIDFDTLAIVNNTGNTANPVVTDPLSTSVGYILYYPPPDYTGTVDLSVALQRRLTSGGNPVPNTTTDLSPVKTPGAGTSFYRFTNTVQDPSPTAVLTTTTGTAYSGGIIGAAKGPAKIGIQITDYDRNKKSQSQNPVDYDIYYSVRQISPSTANVANCGIVHLTFVNSTANVADNISTATDVWGNSIPQPTQKYCGLWNSIDSNDGWNVTPALFDSANPTTGFPTLTYHAPPGYTGNVTLAVDVYKSRPTGNIKLLDGAVMTITVPADNQGAVDSVPPYQPIVVPSLTSSVAVNSINTLNLGLQDPAGRDISVDNNNVLGQVNVKYNYRITQSPVQGVFKWFNPYGNTTTTIGNSLTFTNTSQTLMTTYLSGVYGNSAGINGQYLVYVPTSTGNVNFNVTVDRLQYDAGSVGANSTSSVGNVIGNIRIANNPAWGAGGVTYTIS